MIESGWCIDTSVYTHLCRAGHWSILQHLAPGGTVQVPLEVQDEIDEGRDRYPGIPAVADTGWAQTVVLTEQEQDTLFVALGRMGGGIEHLGECAVIACALHRGLVGLIDERRAIAVAESLGVKSHDTLWLIIEAHSVLDAYSARGTVEQAAQALIDTGMRLPISSGDDLFARAWELGYLPRDTGRP